MFRLGVVERVNWLQAAEESAEEATLNVRLLDGRLLENVAVHYHCEGYHNGLPQDWQTYYGNHEKLRVGFHAFREGDLVILFKESIHFGDGAANYTVVGFADGTPRGCLKCLVFDVANSGIDVRQDHIRASGPYPDARLRAAPADDPAIMRPAERIVYNEYQRRSLQLFGVGGEPPYTYELVTVLHPGCDLNATPGSGYAEVQELGNPFFLVNGTNVTNSPVNMEQIGTRYRWNGIQTTPCAVDGDVGEVRITDANGHSASCWFLVRAAEEAAEPPEPPEPPEPEPAGEIEVSDTQMLVSSQQDVIATGCSGDYSWVITGGGRFDGVDGGQATATGDSVTVYAPSTNAGCTNNSALLLYCDGELVDRIDLTFTNPGVSGDAYFVCECFHSINNPYWATCDGPRYAVSWRAHFYDCSGVFTHTNVCGSVAISCDPNDCFSASLSGCGTCYSIGDGATYDYRNSTKIAQGCCPEALM